jgi:hypothetical protein
MAGSYGKQSVKHRKTTCRCEHDIGPGTAENTFDWDSTLAL